MTTDTPEHISPARPDPLYPESEMHEVHKKMRFGPVLEQLRAGTYVRIADVYPTGLMVLSELKKRIFGKQKDDFQTYRRKRSEYHEASNRLLVPVKENAIALKKAPDVGWLKLLYSDASDFYLPFPKIQGLNSSWQWYQKGIQFPVLDHPVYPYYGTYFPTRFDHLVLFDKWLTKYQGRRDSALDIGTGCGVMAFQLLKQGFSHVSASDINPNAVISVQENARNFGVADRISVQCSDLFEQWKEPADLIVFNPPWLPAEQESSGLDEAIYYKEGLFERFFGQAADYLKEGGRLVVLYSNIARQSGAESSHPMDEELSGHHRFRKERVLKRKVSGGSKKTKRRDNRRQEFVELWELSGNR